jgi:putative oxidoreductase
MPAILFCFIFLYLAARGGGDWSLDAVLRRKRGAASADP